MPIVTSAIGSASLRSVDIGFGEDCSCDDEDCEDCVDCADSVFSEDAAIPELAEDSALLEDLLARIRASRLNSARADSAKSASFMIPPINKQGAKSTPTLLEAESALCLFTSVIYFCLCIYLFYLFTCLRAHDGGEF